MQPAPILIRRRPLELEGGADRDCRVMPPPESTGMRSAEYLDARQIGRAPEGNHLAAFLGGFGPHHDRAPPRPRLTTARANSLLVSLGCARRAARNAPG